MLAIGDEGRRRRGRAGEQIVVVADHDPVGVEADLDVLYGSELRLIEERAALVGIGSRFVLADELVGRRNVVQRVAAARHVYRAERAAARPGLESDRGLVVELIAAAELHAVARPLVMGDVPDQSVLIGLMKIGL